MAGPRGGRLPTLPLGVAGRVAVFLWALLMVMLTPARALPWVAILCLLVLFFSGQGPVPDRLFHPRRLALLALMALPPLFLLGARDRQLWGVAYSSTGAVTAMQIALRFLVVMAAVDGFTRSVEVSELAGLFERLGLKGLGFSLGVALNLLPALQQSSLNAWQALHMRGGFRRQRWRALGYLLVTVITGALRRAEEIALAAEARAFSPDSIRAWPITISPWDGWVIGAAVVSLVVVVFW
jgi:energy-coupling factor transporter transmembrane protein EcfT